MKSGKSGATEGAPSASDRLVLAGDAKRSQIVSTIGAHLQPVLNAIWELDAEAQIGFRGSLAGGLKGPHKLGADMGPVAFDGNVAFKLDRYGKYQPYDGPQGYDVDYFIVSKKLAEDPVFANMRPIQRNVSRLDSSLNDTFGSVHAGMVKDPILAGMKRGPMEFIIRSPAENAKLLNRDSPDPQVYFIRQ